MSFALRRQKALPDIRVNIEASRNLAEDGEHWTIPSSRIATSANTNKALPPIKIENTLSEEDMSQLHELWNGAGLSARAHRRRQRGQLPPTPSRIRGAISVPEPENISPALSSACPSMTGMTPPTSATRKRWGFLSARPLTDMQVVEKKGPSTLEVLRSMAQDRLKKKLRYAKSAPDLGDQTKPPRAERGAQPAMPIRVRATPEEVEASSPQTLVGEPRTPETVLESEDMDRNGIYFRIDPDWRASRGSVEFRFITPIPNSPTSLGRPDSPLLHRHHSLDQLSFAAQEVTKTLSATKFPEECPGDAILREIDDLYAYLELEL